MSCLYEDTLISSPGNTRCTGYRIRGRTGHGCMELQGTTRVVRIVVKVPLWKS